MVTLLLVGACTRITDAELDAKLGVPVGADDTAVEDTRPINEDEIPPEDVVETLFGTVNLDLGTSTRSYTCPGTASVPHDGERFSGDGSCEITLDGVGSGYRLRLRWFGYLDEALVTRGAFRAEDEIAGPCGAVREPVVSGKLVVGSALDFTGLYNTRACSNGNLDGTVDMAGLVTFEGVQ
jgi:hypothetical protein